jgi:ArsR family transcriptional regulator, arsenate/arsenite/antimonite-responsive transcriptional repressor
MFASYYIIIFIMTYAKIENFLESQIELANFARILSHPARIAIIQLLSSKCSCISGDISEELPLSRTTVSQHLQELKNAGLIIGEISGVKNYYCLDIKKINLLIEAFKLFFAPLCESQNNNCR